MNNYVLALFLIFGLGHAKQEPVDPAKGVPLHSRLKCDGYGAPEDLTRDPRDIFSRRLGAPLPGEPLRNRPVRSGNDVSVSAQTRAGWREVWSAANDQPAAHAVLPISSCDDWGSTEPAQYILSAWYQEGAANPKLPWHQATVKQVSTLPEVYEFTDANGGTARLEMTRF